MNDFKDCYQSAVEDMNMLGMKEFHMDASSCIDERRHGRWVIRRMRNTAATAFSAVCMIFLCGFGTVKAAEYFENVIQVKEWGFESADAVTMARSEAGNPNPCAHIISEEIGLVEGENVNASGAGIDFYEDTDGQEGIESEKCELAADSALQKEMAQLEGQALDAEDFNVETEGLAEGEAAKMYGLEEKGEKDEIEGFEINEIPVKNYSSFEEFEENEDIIFPQPSISIGQKAEEVSVTVCGDWAMARYDADGKVIWVERTDYADTQGHASSKVFPGGVCNERKYTTAQGYTYTLVDSVKGEDGEMLQIHGAVTVGSYEAYIDFMGYTEEEAKRIMESIDLSLYE